MILKADTAHAILNSVAETAINGVAEYRLAQNYPNPFNPTTTIGFSLPRKSMVRLDVYNTLGERVATLWRGDLEAGRHEIRLDGRGMASGVYLYRLEAGEFSATMKCVLIR